MFLFTEFYWIWIIWFFFFPLPRSTISYRLPFSSHGMSHKSHALHPTRSLKDVDVRFDWRSISTVRCPTDSGIAEYNCLACRNDWCLECYQDDSSSALCIEDLDRKEMPWILFTRRRVVHVQRDIKPWIQMVEEHKVTHILRERNMTTDFMTVGGFKGIEVEYGMSNLPSELYNLIKLYVRNSRFKRKF